MVNLWIFYALAWLLALWLWDYIKKLVLSKWANKELFLLVCFSLYVPIFFINMLFQGGASISSIDIRDGMILGFTDFLIPLWMLTALKYLNVSFALVTIRLVSSFILLFLWIYTLWDQLSVKNILGFILWAWAIFLLSWFRTNELWNFNLKGTIWLFICTLWIILSHWYLKYIVEGANIPDLMAVKFFITFICVVLYIVVRKKYSSFSKNDFQKIIPYAGITAILFVAHFLYFLPNIYLLWPLSLSYKILSYSLIIPILLSIIFLWEKITKKKALAFLLTVISIALFI